MINKKGIALKDEEKERLKVLKRYQALGPQCASELDALVEMALYVCKTPKGIVSLVDEDQVLFINRKGVETESISRSSSFETHAIQGTDIFEVSDASDNTLFVDNPFVAGTAGIRFYAGAPLTTEDGHNVGVLSVVDTVPRQLDHEQKRMLKMLAGEVMKHLEFEWQKKINEEESTKGENRFRALVENSTDFITVLDAEGIILYESPSFYRVTGYTEEDLIGQQTVEFIHREDKAKAITDFLGVLEGYGCTYTTQFRCRKANGEWMVLDAVGKNALDNETVRGIVINSRDITERKKAEIEIKEKSQILQGIAGNIPVIIYQLDPNGIFTKSIGTGLEKMGLKDNEAVGGNIYELFPEVHEDVRRAYEGSLDPVILKGEHDGKPWYFEFYTFADTANPGGLVGFGLDVTEKKLYEKEQKIYATNLEKVNNELDQFAYIVSHDLKAPLRAITNLSEWIEDDLGDQLKNNPDVKENMSLLRARVRRMELLISGILEYSKAGRSEIVYEATDVESLVNEVIQIIDIPETFEVIKEPLPTIITNNVRLEQIFSNLLSNAVKYHDKPSGKISIGYTEGEEFHEFYVADDGPGIEPEYHEKIFVIFQTLESKDKSESTGVGLSIVKKIIEELGGTITLESKPGEGAKFIFTLPVKKGKMKTVG